MYGEQINLYLYANFCFIFQIKMCKLFSVLYIFRLFIEERFKQKNIKNRIDKLCGIVLMLTKNRHSQIKIEFLLAINKFSFKTI